MDSNLSCLLFLLIFIEIPTAFASVESFFLNLDKADFLTKSFGLNVKRSADDRDDWPRRLRRGDGKDSHLHSVKNYEESQQPMVATGPDVMEDKWFGTREGQNRHRRVSATFDSVGHRRSRSQASRRTRLNSQGLRSHLIHSRRKGMDSEDYYMND